MTETTPNPTCPQHALEEAICAADEGSEKGLAAFEALIAEHSGDPRLHFLKGALLASLERQVEARAALSRCLEIAPGYELARFQLGLLDYLADNHALAANVWAPLLELNDSHPLGLFARGLTAIERGEFDAGLADLERGIGLNRATPALNRDMHRFIEQASAGKAPEQPAEPETVSAAHLLLQQYRARTMH